MELLAKLEEEEGGQDLACEQLRGVILVLEVVLIDAMVVGRDGSVYRHCPRAHQLAFSPPLCCPASRALERPRPGLDNLARQPIQRRPRVELAAAHGVLAGGRVPGGGGGMVVLL